jgi:hypothetical protein
MARSECKVSGCGWTAEAPIKDIAGCAATWHVFERHPEVWESMFGCSPPVDPDPRSDDGLLVILQGNLEEAIDWALSGTLEEILTEAEGGEHG